MAYRIAYSPRAEAHLNALPVRQRKIVLGNVQEQLVYQPAIETKNRKPMRPNPLTASWELRIGPLRVYYSVEEVPEPVVYIYAIGIKDRNRVRVGGLIIDLGEEGPEE